MTDAELAVLSILFEGPITGRALQAEIARRGLRAWTDIGVKSLFYLLEKLERQGLAQRDGSPDQPFDQKYRLTPAGLGVLRTAVAELLSTPRDAGNAFELGLANLHVLRPAQVRGLLASYRQALAARLAQARERRQQVAEEQAAFAIDALFSHRIALLEAELAWIQGWIARWEAQAPPDERTPIQPASEVEPMQRLMLPRDPDSLHRVETNPGRSLPLSDADRSAGLPPGREPEPDTPQDG